MCYYYSFVFFFVVLIYIYIYIYVGATTVLMAKHTDKLEMDKAKGILTAPVLLGKSLAPKVTLAMMGSQYLFVLLSVFMGLFSPVMLLVFGNSSFIICC